MEVAADELESAYRLLSTAVTPRPIAWVSTVDGDGADNLAPFSFFTVASISPPILTFYPVGTGADAKDTARNVAETEQAVVNVVTEDVVAGMNETAATMERGDSEFDRADVTRAESTAVDPPRVAEARVAFECELFDLRTVGSSTQVLAEVVHAHVDDDATTDGKIDTAKLDTVGRLAGSWYATTDDRFSLERPP